MDAISAARGSGPGAVVGPGIGLLPDTVLRMKALGTGLSWVVELGIGVWFSLYIVLAVVGAIVFFPYGLVGLLPAVFAYVVWRDTTG